MSTTRIRVDLDDPSTFPKGRIDAARVDAITEAEITTQEREDESEAMQDMARYLRRVVGFKHSTPADHHHCPVHSNASRMMESTRRLRL